MQCPRSSLPDYVTLPYLWLRKIFPLALFANTNLPEDHFRVWLSEQETKKLSDSSTDIFEKNVVAVDNFCF